MIKIKNTIFISILIQLILPLSLLPAFASPETDLIRAADLGEVHTVKKLLEAGADPKANNSEALLGAIITNNLEIVALLLKYGADPNAIDSNTMGSDIMESNALLEAAIADNEEITKLLLEYGANANAMDSDALIEAAFKSNIEIVKLLLEWGANPNAKDSEALLEAAFKDNVEVVKLLLEHGADPKAKDSDALFGPVTTGNVEIAQLLLEWGADPNALDSQAFINAVSNGNIEMIKLFVKHGADLKISDKLYDNGKKEDALEFDKQYLKAMPDSIDQFVSKWTERGEEAMILKLATNNPEIANQILYKLMKDNKFAEAEEYGNKVLEYWVSQNLEHILKDINEKMNFAINIQSNYYYDEMLKIMNAILENTDIALKNTSIESIKHTLGLNSKRLQNLPLNANVKDISITDFLVHRTYIDQNFLNKYDISLNDARIMLEMDIYELLKENNIIFSILHAVALHAKEDPYYKLNIFKEEYFDTKTTAGKQQILGQCITSLGMIDFYNPTLKSHTIRSLLAHEWTHLLMNTLFHNSYDPFAANDDKAKTAWENTMELIWKQVDETTNIDSSSPYGEAITTYITLKNYYPIPNWGSEMIAYYSTIIANPKLYNDPQVKEFLKPITNYWTQYIQPAIDKYVKDHAAIDKFVSDWERENISDPFYRAKFDNLSSE